LLSACGAPRLEPDIPTGVNLAGAWRLNPQASQDPNALISAIVDNEMKHMRRHRSDDDADDAYLPPVPNTSAGGQPQRGGGANGGSQSSGGGPASFYRPRGGIAAYVRNQYNQALGPLLNSESLVIEQSAERVSLIRGDSRRSYTPGGQSVVSVADGVADQSSGWKGREYVIDVRPQVGPHVTERYSLTADGQLVEKVWLKENDMPKLEFTRVYDKGTPPARTAPTSN
jgi:hypothetical protein